MIGRHDGRDGDSKIIKHKGRVYLAHKVDGRWFYFRGFTEFEPNELIDWTSTDKNLSTKGTITTQSTVNAVGGFINDTNVGTSGIFDAASGETIYVDGGITHGII